MKKILIIGVILVLAFLSYKYFKKKKEEKEEALPEIPGGKTKRPKTYKKLSSIQVQEKAKWLSQYLDNLIIKQSEKVERLSELLTLQKASFIAIAERFKALKGNSLGSVLSGLPFPESDERLKNSILLTLKNLKL